MNFVLIVHLLSVFFYNISFFLKFITILRFGRRLEIDSRTLVETIISNIKFRFELNDGEMFFKRCSLLHP